MPTLSFLYGPKFRDEYHHHGGTFFVLVNARPGLDDFPFFFFDATKRDMGDGREKTRSNSDASNAYEEE